MVTALLIGACQADRTPRSDSSEDTGHAREVAGDAREASRRGPEGKGRPTAIMKEVLDAHASLGPKPLETLSPEEARLQPSMADAAKKWLQDHSRSDAPEPVAKVEDRDYPGAAGSLPLRIYWPSGDGPHPVTVYWHGGGWVIADLNTYDASCRAIANAAGCIVVAAEYPHAPGNKFPAAAEDAFAAYRWTLANAASFGGDPRRVAVAGESAGGNLAAVVCLMAIDQGVQAPVHQVLIYPITNYAFNTPSYRERATAKPLNAAMMKWFWAHYLADERAGSDWRASPLRASESMLMSAPPATVITAEIDPLMSEGNSYAEALRRAGVKVRERTFEGVTHEFFGMGAILPEAKDAERFAAQGLKSAFGR